MFLKKGITVGNKVLIRRPFNAKGSDSKFEEKTGIITAVNGPLTSIATPFRNIQRHKNQIERYTSSVTPDVKVSSDHMALECSSNLAPKK